ncbi:hypothetical protein HDU79_007321 [Rhizoclosmatium sp. JEL0117]|nr:hypothetical protein HDU79_007321 [Rhizoclosmatium sp. JEL0117]
MPSVSSFLATLVLVLSSLQVSAFTNGTLIPGYICNLRDLAHGSPTSLGAIIPLLVEDDSQAKIAGYHQLLTNATRYAAQDLCTATITPASTTAPIEFNVIVKTLGGEHLIGLIVWIQTDVVKNPQRIGTFKKAGLNMLKYPYEGCGETIVHSKALDDDAVVKSESGAILWSPVSPVSMKKVECSSGGMSYGSLGGSGENESSSKEYGDTKSGEKNLKKECMGSVVVRGVCVTAKGYGKFAIPLKLSGGGSCGTNTGGIQKPVSNQGQVTGGGVVASVPAIPIAVSAVYAASSIVGAALPVPATPMASPQAVIPQVTAQISNIPANGVVMNTPAAPGPSATTPKTSNATPVAGVAVVPVSNVAQNANGAKGLVASPANKIFKSTFMIVAGITIIML